MVLYLFTYFYTSLVSQKLFAVRLSSHTLTASFLSFVALNKLLCESLENTQKRHKINYQSFREKTKGNLDKIMY